MSISRNQKRALRKDLAERAKGYPEKLEAVPESEWPAPREGHTRPIGVWRSRDFLVQGYQEETDCVRLTVIRVKLGTGMQWADGITWDELWRVKQEAGYSDWYGVEVYPRERDLVRDCNMRHLWLFDHPLPIGWFSLNRGAPDAP